MTRFARHLQVANVVNPFPGIVALERMLGHAITARIGSNEGLPISNESLSQAFGEWFCELARLYPDPSALALRELIADRFGIAVDEVLFDAGADSLILLCLRMHCDVGDTVITSAGTYPTFKYFAEGVGACVSEVPYRDYQALDQTGRLMPDLDALAERAHAERARVVYLANPDNPTGHYYDRAAIRAFRSQLPAATALILDEAYIDFCEPDAGEIASAENRLTSGNASTEYPNTIRLRTLSKAYAAAGLRLGYALADSEWIKKANTVRIHYAISNIAQAAGVLLLKDEAYRRRMIRETIAMRQQLQTGLQQVVGNSGVLRILPSSTNFIAARYADSATAASVQKALWQQQVAVHRPPHPSLQHILRVTASQAAVSENVLHALSARS